MPQLAHKQEGMSLQEDSEYTQTSKFGVLMASICPAPPWLQRMLLRGADSDAGTAPGARRRFILGDLPRSKEESGRWQSSLGLMVGKVKANGPFNASILGIKEKSL